MATVCEGPIRHASRLPSGSFSHADREEFPGKSGTRADVFSGLMTSVWNGADPERLAETHRRPAKAGTRGAHFTLSPRRPGERVG